MRSAVGLAGRLRNCFVAAETKLSHTAAMILQAIHAGHGYGFSVMEMTGLPSGTVYPVRRCAGWSVTS